MEAGSGLDRARSSGIGGRRLGVDLVILRLLRGLRRYPCPPTSPEFDLFPFLRPQNITKIKSRIAIGAQTKLGAFCTTWFKNRVKAVKHPPAMTTDRGSSLLDAALKPSIRNSIPSPALPGSTSREKGTRKESTNKTRQTQGGGRLPRVHSTPFHFGSNFSPQLTLSLNFTDCPLASRG